LFEEVSNGIRVTANDAVALFAVYNEHESGHSIDGKGAGRVGRGVQVEFEEQDGWEYIAEAPNRRTHPMARLAP